MHTPMLPDSEIYDLTLINAVEILLQKLARRHTDGKKLYHISRMQNDLHRLECTYIGFVPEEYRHKADVFDNHINDALTNLQSLIKGEV